MAGIKVLKKATDGNGYTEVATTNTSADSPTVGTPVSVNASGKIDSTLLDVASSGSGPTASGKPATYDADGQISSSIIDSSLDNMGGMWSPVANTTTMNVMGTAITATGTAAARVISSVGYYVAHKRLGYNTTAVAGTLAGPREANGYVWRGNLAGLGGFRYSIIFGFSAIVAGARAHIGLSASPAAPTNVEPNTLTNVIGLQKLAAGTNLQFFMRDNTATNTATDLGANFPATTALVDMYEFQVYCPIFGTDLQYKVTRLNTGNTTGWVTVSTGIPQNTLFLGNNCWLTNNATATLVGLDIFHMSLVPLS